MRTDVTMINEKTPWQGLTEGLQMFAGGTAKYFATGEWRTNTPVLVQDKCRQCLLCVPVCPDVSIPVKDGKRLDDWILIMTTARAAESARAYVLSAPLR